MATIRSLALKRHLGRIVRTYASFGNRGCAGYAAVVPRFSSSHLWELIVAALGINLWVTFLFIPLSEQADAPGRLVVGCAAFALIVLFVGLGLRSATILLGAFPSAIVLPVYLHSRLAGADVYSGWTFLFVALGLLGYTVGALVALQLADRRALAPHRQREVRSSQHVAVWRRRVRMAVAFAGATLAFPLLAIWALVLRPTAASDWPLAYPARADAATTFFVLLVICLWLTVYQLCLRRPLQKHLEGDPEIHAALQRERTKGARWLRLSAYVIVAVAAAAGLVLSRWARI